MTVVIINDDRSSLSILEQQLLNNYEHMISNGGERNDIERSDKMNWELCEINLHKFWVCTDFSFRISKGYDYLLGLVIKQNGKAERRWWWRSSSTGSWRAGIRFSESYISKGVKDQWTGGVILPQGHSYKPGLGYNTETAVCRELQVTFDRILGNKEKHKFFLDITFTQARTIANHNHFDFLQYVLLYSAQQYAQADTLPKYYTVSSIGSSSAEITEGYAKDILNSNSSDHDRDNVFNKANVSIGKYRGDIRPFIQGMLNAITHKGSHHTHGYHFKTNNIPGAKVYIYRCPITVDNEPHLSHLVFEIAISDTPEQNYTTITKDKGSVFSVWVKQIYLHSRVYQHVTSFGNYRYFAQNLIGLIQKSADYEQQTLSIQRLKPNVTSGKSYHGELVGQYRHLARWNEKSSDLVRCFNQTMNIRRKYRTFPEKQFESRVKIYIGQWFAERAQRSCDEYLLTHSNVSPCIPWSLINYPDVHIWVAQLKAHLTEIGTGYDDVQNCFAELLNNQSIKTVRYKGSIRSTRSFSYLSILSNFLKGSTNLSQFNDEANQNNFNKWREKIYTSALGKLWLDSDNMTPQKIINSFKSGGSCWPGGFGKISPKLT